MENFITTDATFKNEGIQHLDGENEFIDPQEINDVERKNRLMRHRMRNTAKLIREAGKNKNRKMLLMKVLKTKHPQISLRRFCEAYVKSDNVDSLEDIENMQIAEHVEEHISKRRRAKKAKRKARRKGRKSKRKTRRKEKKKYGGFFKRAAKKAASVTVLAPLLPFKPMMKKALKSKGITFGRGSSFVDVVTAYYKKVVKGDNFEMLPDDWYENDIMFYEPIENIDSDHVASSALTTIVTEVVNFIKRARAKKKAGVPMNTQEKMTADATDKVIKKVEDKTGADIKDLTAPPPLPPEVQNKRMITIGIGVVIVVILLVVLKK